MGFKNALRFVKVGGHTLIGCAKEVNLGKQRGQLVLMLADWYTIKTGTLLMDIASRSLYLESYL
jgi:hypothetical protein